MTDQTQTQTTNVSVSSESGSESEHVVKQSQSQKSSGKRTQTDSSESVELSEEYKPETEQEYKLSVKCERNACLDNTLIPVPVTTVGGTEEKWCPSCVKEEFGVDYVEQQQKEASILRFVTPETVGAFFTGVILMFLIASVMIV